MTSPHDNVGNEFMLGPGMAKDKLVGMVNILMDETDMLKDASTFAAIFELMALPTAVRADEQLTIRNLDRPCASCASQPCMKADMSVMNGHVRRR
jgi:hypothetical protein